MVPAFINASTAASQSTVPQRTGSASSVFFNALLTTSFNLWGGIWVHCSIGGGLIKIALKTTAEVFPERRLPGRHLVSTAQEKDIRTLIWLPRACSGDM
jgi:hypothetical protein